MACDDADAAEDLVDAGAQGPLEVQGDAGRVRQHSLKDLMEYERFKRAKCAQRNGVFPVKLFQAKPPGPV